MSHPSWRRALRRSDGSVEAWLAALAQHLLKGVRFVVGDEPHRLVEVEAYYHSADHPDPFAHRDPVQLEQARWYFHRTRGTYRSGGFKGVDLSFGDGTAFGGMLLRSLETADGTLVDGPSLLVDHLLTRSGKCDVTTLDLAIGGREADNRESPLRLEAIDEPTGPITTSARVGLSLKKNKPSAENVRYLLCPYRYLSEPGRTAKGRQYVVLALIQQGLTDDAIHEATGCPTGTIRRYRADFEVGRADVHDLSSYGGVELGTKELSRLHGYGAK